ncbi:MAG: GntR family transcriptional regulator [Verrucomicrobium sp.]|nr:GntR family transcriptional regulator [Verrucomicrobium sp.]
MPLALTLSPASDAPLYRQIVLQVAQAVASGRLAVGEQLPAVRALAEAHVVNPNTVARAYQDLIREGLLESRPGVGVFVVERRPLLSEAERERRLAEAAARFAQEVALLGFSPAAARAALDKHWKRSPR